LKRPELSGPGIGPALLWRLDQGTRKTGTGTACPERSRRILRSRLYLSPLSGYNSAMTPETTRDKQRRKPGGTVDPIQAAADYGIDVAQLRDNLALTVAERLRRHQIALNTVEMLQKAKRL